MNHIGWFSRESAEYYGRKHSLVDSTIVASKLANSLPISDTTLKRYPLVKSTLHDLQKFT
jgi:hypothetical protein